MLQSCSFILFVCECVCACTHTRARTLTGASSCACVRTQRGKLGLLLFHSLPYSFRKGSPIELELGWWPQTPVILMSFLVHSTALYSSAWLHLAFAWVLGSKFSFSCSRSKCFCHFSSLTFFSKVDI